MRATRRGHALPLVLVTLTVAMVSLTVFSTRVLSSISTRRSADARAQALWLARSACRAGLKDARVEVKTAAGAAVLTRTRDVARVRLAGGAAEVTCATGQERYRAP
jgi:type II secretory pathway component PulK